MKLLMCNLKANKNLREFVEYIKKIKEITNKDNLVIFPSYLYLAILNNQNINFGAQNVSVYEDGSNTGEVTISQIKSTGAKYLIVGHSERRKKYNEDEYILLKKIRQSLKYNIQVVYCIGETKEERARNKTYQVLEKQIAKIFNSLSQEEMENIIIAYEPVWAIGTGQTASATEVDEISKFIKTLIKDYYDRDNKLLYGGSVNKDNIKTLCKISSIDGFLVGKASLEAEEVAEMLKVCSK